jgi:hybrid cluster-associated redox disulfide protein
LDPSGSPDPHMSLDEIMRRWPATIAVFIRHGMLCVGCPIGIFHTVGDACAAHDVERNRVEEDISGAMRDDENGTPGHSARRRGS